MEHWKPCIKGREVYTALSQGALNPARRCERDNYKEATLSAVRYTGLLKGTVLIVMFDFLHVLNHKAQCFLARLEIGMPGQRYKAEDKSTGWPRKPGVRGWGWALTVETGGRN